MCKQDKADRLFSLFLLSFSLLFYLFFAFCDGAVIAVDSPSYITMDLSREPFYPVFLALLRSLFYDYGDFYLTAAAFLQSILAGFAAYSLTDFLRKELRTGKAVSLLLLAMPLAASLLCRFAARRSSMYSNSILTEGIAISLFLIFIRCLLEYCFHQTKKSLALSCLISFIMISTRKQMLLTLILLVLGLIYVIFKNKALRKPSSLLTPLLCAGGILFACFLFDHGYNYALRGSFSSHSSDNRFLATMVFYTAEREDGAAISHETTRILFEQIYDACEKQGYLMHSAGKGWYGRVTHFGDHYDHIQIDTMWPMIRSYVRENHEGDPVYLEALVDAYTQEIITALLPEVWPKILLAFSDNFLSGLVTTVAKKTPLLVLYSILIYSLYLGLLLFWIRKKGFDRLALLAAGTLLSIFLNVGIVSAVIFCQTRYTIYNMPLFYISLILLLFNVGKSLWLRSRLPASNPGQASPIR